MSKMKKMTVPILAIYLWVLMTIFGAIVLETFMIYPNIFHNPPQSLELSMEFFVEAGPSDFFPPLGFASWVLGALALILTWKIPRARWWIVLSLAMMVGEGLASMLYFWPRNDIMFIEGSAAHSDEYLRQVANEFVTWHARSRMVFNTVAAVAAFVAFLAAYRQRVVTARAGREPRVSAVPNS